MMRVRDPTWLVVANTQTNCFKASEAAEVLWDGVTEVNYPAGKSITEFKPNLWNKDKLGSLYKDLGNIDYGIS